MTPSLPNIEDPHPVASHSSAVLCNASPLVALLDVRQGERHIHAQHYFPTLQTPLLTTWPCFTEAIHTVGQLGGWPMQELLWQMVRSGSLEIHSSDESELLQAAELMKQYQHVPMRLADATLVAAANKVGAKRIFTFDRVFIVYRLISGEVLEIIP